MFKVDVDKLLNQYLNPHVPQTRYPNPFFDNEFVSDDFDSDEFRMYSFKIKKCPLNRAHDWTVCPYAHRGERARRRDLHQLPYAAVSCPDFRSSNGFCPRGELCEYAHGVFEYWLHPAKYRTRPCNAGRFCARTVCFFAHSPDQLRQPVHHQPPRWVRVAIRAEAEARAGGSSTSRGGGGGQGFGVIGRPNKTTSIMEASSSSRANEKPKELFSELLESLTMLRINEYSSNNYVQRNNITNNNNNVDSEIPNFDWVSDLLTN